MASPARMAGAALALGCFATAGLVFAPPAAAGKTTMRVHCELPLGQAAQEGDQDVTIDVPTEPVAPGQKFTVRVTLGGSPAVSPLPFPGTMLTPSIELTMSGGATGVVKVQGKQMRVDIPGTPEQILVPPYEGEIELPAGATGEVHFAPGKMVTSTLIIGDQVTTCFPLTPAAPAATVRVAAATDAPSGATTASGAPETVAKPPVRPADPSISVPGPYASDYAVMAGDAETDGKPDDDDGPGSGTVVAVVAGVVLIAMAVVAMVLSWRRHRDDD